MSNWRCSCGEHNDIEDPDCPSCGRRRPLDRAKADYCVGRGHSYNGALTYCTFCGYRPDEDPRPREAAAQPPAAPTAGVAGDILANLQQMNQHMLDDIRQQVASSMAGIAGVPGAAAVAPSRPRGINRTAVERASTRTIGLSVAALPRLNYALLHTGLPLISRIELTNSDAQPANDIVMRAWVAPDYGEAWQTTVGTIPAGGRHVEENIVVPLTKSRLQEVREAERATLRIDILSEGTLVQSQTLPIEVLAYTEWYYHPAIPHTAACFVQPNSPAIDEIVSKVRDRLANQGADPSLSGYQQGGSARVAELASALYETLQQDASISYINPPPSFEQPQMLGDGTFTLSQKVFFPEHIREHRRGTCLDLAFLGAACLERMGLNPLFFVIHGHAFFGVWLEPSQLREPFTRDPRLVADLISGKKWLPINSTTFTATPRRDFATALDEARDCLSDPSTLMAVVDIAAARSAGIKPVPPLVRG